ncbi:MAG: YlxR family protein [Firmicutes bacterium]|nr:YlxR family protein [Bacillota bacterium]
MKRIPVRTCVACRSTGDKRGLVRFVRTPLGQVELDPTGKKSGRGAYVCPREECFDKALAGPLAKALKVTLSAEDKERLVKEFANR